MSFLSFYNDSHGRANEAIMNLIKKEDWEQVDFAARTDPLAIHWKVKVENFFGSQQPSEVIPLHVVCQKSQVPESLLSTFHDIHPKDLLTEESLYQRLPLHIACMNGNMSTEFLLHMIQLEPDAAKQNDALGRLAIHYACRNTSVGDMVVAHLLKAHPESLTVPDRQGFLPIHVACRSGMSPALIGLMLQRAPDTVQKKTKKGSTPHSCAKQMKDDVRHKEDVLNLIRKASSGDPIESILGTRRP